MADERYITEDPELDDGQTADEDGEGAGLYEHFAVVADKGQAPLRLDKFLTVRMEKCSRNRIQAAADSGSILVNGKAAKSSYKVKPLDRIQIVMPYPRREVEIIPENIPLEIPYEDDDLLIVNKPAGLVVHPGHGNYGVPRLYKGEHRGGEGMRTVHKADADERGLRAEYLGIYLIERLAAEIVVAVAGCTGKARLSDAVVLKCFHHAARVYFGDAVYLRKSSCKALLRLCGHIVYLRPDV